eukprot:scaffold80376_cov26-Tisochrysis_lutea.AAC.3
MAIAGVSAAIAYEACALAPSALSEPTFGLDSRAAAALPEPTLLPDCRAIGVTIKQIAFTPIVPMAQCPEALPPPPASKLDAAGCTAQRAPRSVVSRAAASAATIASARAVSLWRICSSPHSRSTSSHATLPPARAFIVNSPECCTDSSSLVSATARALWPAVSLASPRPCVDGALAASLLVGVGATDGLASTSSRTSRRTRARAA